MRKGLREIADQPAAARLVFFAQEPDIVPQRQKMTEQLQRLLAAAQHQIGVGEPEAAREEHALAGRQAILGRGAVVTKHKPVNHELLLDCHDSRNDRSEEHTSELQSLAY